MAEKRRQLDEKEREIVKKAVAQKKEELAYLFYLREYSVLALEKGVDFNAWKQKQQLSQQVRAMSNEIETTTKDIEVLNEQLEKGVAVKENKKEDKNG